MTTWMKRTGLIVALALIAVLVFSAVSFAQESDGDEDASPPRGWVFDSGRGFHRFGAGPGMQGFLFGGPWLGDAEAHKEALAEALGMTVEELEAALAEGATIRELAEEAGVDLDAVMLSLMQERLAQAVEEGEITQEQADAMLERMQTMHEQGGRFFRFQGRGFGMMGPRHQMGHPGGFGITAVAEALDLTPQEFVEALQDGQTVEDLANAAGVDLAELQQDLGAQMLERLQEHASGERFPGRGPNR